MKDTPLKEQDSWNDLLESVNPSCVKSKGNKQKVYIIKNCIGDYKIGISADVCGRFKELLVGNSEPLEVIRLYRVNTPKRSEKTLHERYESIRKRGEWFSRELDLKDVDTFVRECLAGYIEYSNESDKVWIVS